MSLTRVHAFEAGKHYYQWADDILRDYDPIIIAVPLSSFFEDLGVNRASLQEAIRAEPPASPDEIQPIPAADVILNEAMRKAGSGLIQWFALGKRWSDVRRDCLPPRDPVRLHEWIPILRRGMEASGITLRDRDKVENELSKGLGAANKPPSLKNSFDRAEEQLRDSASKLDEKANRTDESDQKKESKKSTLAWIGGAVAALALIVTNVETLQKAWCNYIAVFCSFKVVSYPVSVSSGGTSGSYQHDDQCKEHYADACVKPSTSWRRLEVGSGKFVASSAVGRYDDGLPLDNPKVPKDRDHHPLIGWYPKSDTESEICVTVFSSTGACETKNSLEGKLEATEQVQLW